MPIYNIRGIDVDFPYDAYDCQIVYMEKVIQSLQERCNALLESPTGTGKTLCLLCATLAWRKSLGDFSSKTNEDQSPEFGSQPFGTPSTQHQRSSMPTIIYTSRTHSQLKQVVRELKASNYRPKMAVLGSREQLCIHDDVQLLQGRAQNNACQHLRRKRSCHHHSRVPDYMKMHPELGNDPIDIEDLVNIGRKDGPCPYYISRELHKVVDILFAPYNYLIDPGNRRSLMGIQWRDSVLIFDEAHNLEPICADAASFDLPSGYLTACISEAQQCVALSSKMRAVEKSAEKRFDPDTYEILKALLLKLERRIAEVVIESKELGFTRPGPYIYEFLSEMNITFKTANSLIGTIDNAAILLEEALVVSGDGNKAKNTVCRLESIRDILNIIFRDGGEDHAKYYRFHVQECQQKASDTVKGKVSRTLSWWCFNPGVAMEQFTKLEVRSIILTSGTLSPLDSFAMELHLDFPVRLENPHVISSNQVWVGVVPSGPSGCSFNSSFRYRDSLEYRQELGNAIVNFSRIVPDGLLVFFPSYYLMDQCIECWKNMSHASSTVMSTIWERICRNKQPVVEPKQSALFAHAIEDFKAKLRDTSTSGVVFFAVCRGKVSEGLDFADHYGRAVVITGMPFPTLTDPKIRLKREYLDQAASSQKKDSKVLIGVEWYFQQASRAVNQAIGRVIRHRHDYGAIVFCDERFAQQNHQNQVSLWLQPHIKCYPRFGDAVFTLTKFFREQGTCESLKPKVAESLNTVNDCEVKIFQPCDRIFSTKDATTLVAEECSRRSLSSMLVSSRGKTADYLEEIIPANRSMLSHKQDHLIPMKHSRDLLCFQRLQTVNVKRKDLQYQDCEVVDLTGDAPAEEQPRIDDVMAPCSSKKSKIKEAGHDEKLHFEKLAHVDQFDNVDSELLPMKSFFSNLEKHHKQISQVLSCGTADVRIHGNTQRALVSSEMISRSMLTRNKDSRGSAFLLQVQENLTTAEYKEFVGHMKALKSKTSKVISVLESIAKLFSAPGRLFLLKRFKDYVPVRYQPLYEEYLKAQDAAFGSEGDLDFTV